ncbi:hypothetical protein COE67_17045 [Priestia megaterium]|jgi:hypothetical protein|nr:putative neutral ceramidase superfamily lipid hydrolase [Bacillus sp. PvP124]MDP9580109.1 putative neutral ceramidase superfamily lipid hydrolase [Bacillus sp. 1751]MDP9726416.1 putative neutral ceramidase superfamily lipid hydrolase [Priestia aryabhattai]PEA35279.1 hypothetical protein CON45_30865 [Priestia megaterium]PEE44937.1 hypothetical protein COM71_23545 [Priestia megaterium]
MIKANLLICISLILATVSGIFGQDISYFIDKHIMKLSPIYYLTAITYISIFLYLLTILLTYIFNKKNKLKKSILDLYWLVILGFSLFISFWSLFVLAMWWG